MIYPNEEEEDLILRIDELLFSGSSRYDSKLDKNKKFIIKLKDDPRLLEPFIIHRSHYYLKNELTKEISDDPLFPGFVLLKNVEINNNIKEKLVDERPIKREEMKNRLKENFMDTLINAGLEVFSYNLMVSEKLMSEHEKLRSFVKSAIKGRKNTKKIVNELKKILPENEDVLKSREMEESYQDLLDLSPALLNDIIGLWLYEKLEKLIDYSLAFKSKDCFGLSDYNSIVNLMSTLEKYDLIKPILSLSICCKPECEFQSISNNKIDTINCPNCKSEGSLFSAILYKFDELIEDLYFDNKILSDHSYISYLIAHYLHFFSEQRLDVYPLRYISVDGAEKPEEIDVLAINQHNDPLVIECKIYRDRDGDYDKIKSSCINGVKQLKRKMEFIGSHEGYLITNLRSISSVAKINKLDKIRDSGIKIISSSEIIPTMNEIVKSQMIAETEVT